MSMDLGSYTLKELRELQVKVAKAIATFEDRKKKEALAELEERARSLGFSLAELTGATPARKRSPAVPKYANPADASDTWSGRGRKPRWFAAALKAGKKPEDMAI
ncbi:MAG: H-NS histone family protein [Tabrizicola sp.]|nr:H-NS histone family protein [Tabrizicola sp.]